MDSGKRLLRNIGRFAIAAIASWLILQCLIEGCTVDENKPAPSNYVTVEPEPEF